MLSGKLLNWYPSKPNYCHAVSWKILSGRQLSWFPLRRNFPKLIRCNIKLMQIRDTLKAHLG